MKGIYAIRDRVANVFTAVNVDTSDHTAKRNFVFSINNVDMLKFCCKDYELCKLAEFDDVSGKIEPLVPIEMICRGDEVLNV